MEAKRRIYQRDEGCCCQCGADVTLGSRVLDHIRPLSRGGGHDDDNLQTLCKACSDRKTAGEQTGYTP